MPRCLFTRTIARQCRTCLACRRARRLSNSERSSHCERAPVGGRQMLVRSDHQSFEVCAYLVAVPLAARNSGAAAKHQEKVAARRAVHLAHMIDVDHTGAANAEHRLQAHCFLCVPQCCARVERILAYAQYHVVSIGLDRFDLDDIDHLHSTAGIREQTGSCFRGLARSSLQLREECSECGLAVCAGLCRIATADTGKRRAKALFVEWLEQVVDRAYF